jgi:hypothetical protein
MDRPVLAAQTPVRPAWSNMEHRCGDRRPANLAVRLILPPREVLLGRIREISLSGAFVQTHRELPPLSRILVDFRAVPGMSAPLLRRIEGYVIRNGRTGVGIEWADFAPPTVREQWTALANGAPGHTRRAAGRRIQERRIVLGSGWLVYYPVELENKAGRGPR